MKNKCLLAGVSLCVLLSAAYLLMLQKPGWFLTRCSSPSCYQEIIVGAVRFYKSPFNSAIITESSGVVASRKHPGTIWTHNDSGSRSWLYAVDRYGNLQGASYIADTWAIDWEDIATDDQGRLYVLDYSLIGDEQVVHIIAEPDPHGLSISKTSEKIRFTIADIPRDDDGDISFKAESLMWFERRLYLLSKHGRRKQTTLYRFPEARSAAPVVLEPVAQLDLSHEQFEFGGNVTAADISPDGRMLAVLSYWGVYLFELDAEDHDFFARPAGSYISQGVTGQAEGVTWLGDDLVISNEEDYLFLIEGVLSAAQVKP